MAVVGEFGLRQVDAAAAVVDAARGGYGPRCSIACAMACTRDLAMLGEAELRFLARTDWGFVHQDPALGPTHGGVRPAPMSASG